MQTTHCPSGEFAQIVKAWGLINNSSAAMKKWVVDNALENLSKFTSQELYMFVYGAHKILSREVRSTIFANLALLRDKKDLLKGLRPHGLGALLKTIVDAEASKTLSKEILELIIERLEEFSLQELVDLIAGLSPSFFEGDERVLKLLEYIEERFVIDYDKINLSMLLEHFAKIGYIPQGELLAVIRKFLANPEKPIWDRIHLLSAAAFLNLHEFKNATHLMLDELYHNERYKNLYASDLVSIIYAAGVMFDKKEAPAVGTKMIYRVLDSQHNLDFKQKNMLKDSLRALAYYNLAEEIPNHQENNYVSYSQSEVAKAVQNWFNVHDLKNIRVLLEGDVKGRKVDILINGFEKIGRPGQCPLVIEIDGPFHYACNMADFPLGNSVIREKSIRNLGLEYHVFKLSRRLDDTIAQVERFLDNKWQRCWS